MDQRGYRMPATGEAWRHYKGGPKSLYTIIGMGVDDKGDAQVVYTHYEWGLIQLPPIFTQSLARFLQQVEHGTPRFTFERGREDDPRCAFIHPKLGRGRQT